VSTARAEPSRRTQRERREATIRKLLDAATEALIDVGYGAASVQVVCERAGVSQGALFRHFDTREALMVAVGRDVGSKALERYRRDFEALREREDSMVLALRLVRERCHSRLNQAWYELAMAARTSPGLRKGLRPVAVEYHASIVRLARELLPELAQSMGDRFQALVETIVAVFDGESVVRFVLPRLPDQDAKLELLGALAGAAARRSR
jgi:AcrR family transcriptional regulator